MAGAEAAREFNPPFRGEFDEGFLHRVLKALSDPFFMPKGNTAQGAARSAPRPTLHIRERTEPVSSSGLGREELQPIRHNYSCLSNVSALDVSALPGASSMLSFFTTPSSTSME